MQYEITKPHPLLNHKGELAERGYARDLILDYNRKTIHASALKIKEWDYYLVANNDFGVALTIADNGYMGLHSISLIDFRTPWEKTTSPMIFFPFGKTGLPESSKSGDASYNGKDYSISFKKYEKKRQLIFYMKKFDGSKPIEGQITLDCPEDESMVIATPFSGAPKAFYYNQKINCMPASGTIRYDGKDYVFNPEDSFGVLDWGRGVWTYKNTWYWGSASGLADGKRFGFNIGYGFGDTSAATENMVFFQGKAHKLSNVSFNIPMKNSTEDFMSPWTFTSDDNRFEMDFAPIIDRASCTDVKVICSDQHQVFGKFSGKAVLDDGTVLEIADLLGFAEKVYNKW